MRKDAPGFTLLEGIVGVAVAAVLCSLALPGFSELLRRQRSATAMHLISAQLAQARSTAISRGQPVTLCPTAGDGHCRADADWSRGWMLYLDPGSREQPLRGDHILRQLPEPLPRGVQLYSSSARARIRYQPDGRSAGSNLTLRVCSGEELVGEIVLNNFGRARTQKPAPGTACPMNQPGG